MLEHSSHYGPVASHRPLSIHVRQRKPKDKNSSNNNNCSTYYKYKGMSSSGGHSIGQIEPDGTSNRGVVRSISSPVLPTSPTSTVNRSHKKISISSLCNSEANSTIPPPVVRSDHSRPSWALPVTPPESHLAYTNRAKNGPPSLPLLHIALNYGLQSNPPMSHRREHDLSFSNNSTKDLSHFSQLPPLNNSHYSSHYQAEEQGHVTVLPTPFIGEHEFKREESSINVVNTRQQSSAALAAIASRATAYNTSVQRDTSSIGAVTVKPRSNKAYTQEQSHFMEYFRAKLGKWEEVYEFFDARWPSERDTKASLNSRQYRDNYIPRLDANGDYIRDANSVGTGSSLQLPGLRDELRYIMKKCNIRMRSDPDGERWRDYTDFLTRCPEIATCQDNPFYVDTEMKRVRYDWVSEEDREFCRALIIKRNGIPLPGAYRETRQLRDDRPISQRAHDRAPPHQSDEKATRAKVIAYRLAHNMPPYPLKRGSESELASDTSDVDSNKPLYARLYVHGVSDPTNPHPSWFPCSSGTRATIAVQPFQHTTSSSPTISPQPTSSPTRAQSASTRNTRGGRSLWNHTQNEETRLRGRRRAKIEGRVKAEEDSKRKSATSSKYPEIIHAQRRITSDEDTPMSDSNKTISYLPSCSSTSTDAATATVLKPEPDSPQQRLETALLLDRDGRWMFKVE